MISDENLRQLREMITAIVDTALEAHGLKKVTDRQRTLNAGRQQRFRDRNAARNARVTLARAKRNASSNVNVTPINGTAVAYIPIVGGVEFGVSAALLAELEAAYPAVDGPATLLEIRAWCVTNPDKQKTARGVPRFLNGWFERLQNRG